MTKQGIGESQERMQHSGTSSSTAFTPPKPVRPRGGRGDQDSDGKSPVGQR